MKKTQAVGPLGADFDGSRGFVFYGSGGKKLRFQLLRGNQLPSQSPEVNFVEQLAWMKIKGEQPKLLWCNKEDQWFELQFIPIAKP